MIPSLANRKILTGLCRGKERRSGAAPGVKNFLCLSESSRSFALMRVEILANAVLPKTPPQAPENRALQALLQSVNGEESFFRISLCEAPQEASQDSSRHNQCAGSFLLKFSDEALNQQRAQYFALLESLRELLVKAGSEDSLEARLGLANSAGPGEQGAAYALYLQLIARGDSAAQAELRWGLGVAHLQQAVLFSARLLRKKLSSANAGL
jgi:hypothetical protein